jgi:hypothetical protein
MSRVSYDPRRSGGLGIALTESQAVWIAKERKYWRKVSKKEKFKATMEAKARSKITLPKLKFLDGGDK